MDTWRTALPPVLALAALYYFVTPYMWIASIAYFMMTTGVIIRKRSRRVHAYMMSVAMGLDLSLVLLLEIQRHAIATAMEFSLSPLQQAHIAVSSLATLLYLPIFTLGMILLKQATPSIAVRQWHIWLGVLAFAFRSLGFLLMFSMLGHHPS